MHTGIAFPHSDCLYALQALINKRHKAHRTPVTIKTATIKEKGTAAALDAHDLTRTSIFS